MLTVNLDKVLKDLGTSTAARTDYRVFTCLTEHMNDNGVSAVPQSLLSEETGFRRRTVSNSIQRLEEKGFFTIERNMTEHGGIATNIYHINPQYLIKPAQNNTKPQCAACCECKQSERKHSQCGHKPEITIDDVLAYSGANSQRIEGLCKRVTKLEDHQCDVDDHLARIGEVAADVLKEIFALYEEESK